MGPRGVGKTSVSNAIAQMTGLEAFHLDDRCHEFYLADPRFLGAANAVGAVGNAEGLAKVFNELGRRLGPDCLQFQESLHLLALRATFATVRQTIIDLGSGHSSFVLAPSLRELEEILSPHPTVCLWPSSSFDQSVAILSERNQRSRAETTDALNLHMGREIAKTIVYTQRDSVDRVAEEVLRRIGRTNSKKTMGGVG